MASVFSNAAPSAAANDAANRQADRRKHPRNLLVLLASVGVLGAIAAALPYSHWTPNQTSGTTASGATHASVAAATQCLKARRALVTPSGGRDFPTATGIRASFALLPTRALDSAILYFEPDNATAHRDLAGLAARQKQNLSSSAFKSYFQIKNDVVVFWENPKAALASRSAVLGCLS
jgi:hypothetical protein